MSRFGDIAWLPEVSIRSFGQLVKVKKLDEHSFEKVDFIIMPTVPKLPHEIGEKLSVEENYSYDSLTTLANLAEIPAISVPAGEIDGVPVGLQILGAYGSDKDLLKFSKEFE